MTLRHSSLGGKRSQDSQNSFETDYLLLLKCDTPLSPIFKVIHHRVDFLLDHIVGPCKLPSSEFVAMVQIRELFILLDPRARKSSQSFYQSEHQAVWET